MRHVTSADGTSIAYDRLGDGPAVVLVGGSLTSRSEGIGNNARLAEALSERFTVYNYDRRGRGDSGDTLPYAVEREVEDLEAVIAEAGGSAHVYGVSAGGGLALLAAAAGVPVDRIAVYDVPYTVAEETRERARSFAAGLGPALAAGRGDDALVLFMRFAGSSAEEIEGARSSPYWPGLLALAHTLAYDTACMSDYVLPTARLRIVTRPVLVMTGGVPGLRGLPPDFFAQAAAAIAAAVPHGVRQTLVGESHTPDPRRLAELLERFFLA